MGRQQSPHPFQLGLANGAALHDQILFHALALQMPPNRVPSKIKLFFACLQAPATLILPSSEPESRE
jgi:hypothetical protein